MEDNESASYNNFAFISYKRSDEKWAKWLQDKLESYQLPTSILSQHPNIRGDLKPIFRDKTDFGGGFLSSTISAALADSKYLIVICSPQSANAEWVNKEIEDFLKTHPDEFVIPFIVDGAPFSKEDNEECFPPALRNLDPNKEILGININETGKEQAFVKLVATLLGLRFDLLWQRELRRLRRRKIALYVFFSFLLVSALSVAFSFRAQNKRLLETQNQLLSSQSRYIAKEAKQLLENGNTLIAARLALSVLPIDSNNPDRPYVDEAAQVMKACLDTILYSDNCSRLRVGNDRFWSANRFTHNYDGSMFAISYEDGLVELYDSKNGKKTKTLNPFNITSNSSKLLLGFSKDNDWLLMANADSSYVKTINLQSWIIKQFSDDNIKNLHEVYFLGSGEDLRICLSGDSTICEWDIKGQLLHKYEMNEKVGDIVFDYTRTHIKYIKTTNAIFQIEPTNNTLIKIANNIVGYNCILNPDGFIIYILGDSNIIAYNLIDRRVETISEPFFIRSASLLGSDYLEISDDGQYLLSIQKDSTLSVRDAHSLNITWCMKFTDDVAKASFINDKEICAITNDGIVHIISLLTGIEKRKLYSNNYLSIYPYSYPEIIVPGNKISFLNNNKEGVILDISDNLYSIPELAETAIGSITDICICEPNEIAALITDKGLILFYDYINDSIVDEWHFNCSEIEQPCCAYSNQGILAVATNSLSLYTGEDDAHIIPLFSTADDISFSPDGDELMVIDDINRVYFINPHTFEITDTIRFPSKLGFTGNLVRRTLNLPLNKLAYNPNGKVCAVSTSDSIYIISCNDHSQVSNIIGHAGSIVSLTYTNDGKQLISSSYDGTIKFWNYFTLKEETTWTDKIPFNDISVSNDGTKLFCTGDNMVLAYNLSDATLFNQYTITPSILNNIFYPSRIIPFVEINNNGSLLIGGKKPCIRNYFNFDETRCKLIDIVGDYKLTDEEEEKYNLR